jgi:hypothetical protein
MSVTSQKNQPKPWNIHFFQRDKADDSERAVPAIEFLDSIPAKVAAEIHAVLDAVAAAPPPSFSGGGKWEAMHDDMAGLLRGASPGRRHEPPAVLRPGARRQGSWRVQHRVH